MNGIEPQPLAKIDVVTLHSNDDMHNSTDYDWHLIEKENLKAAVEWLKQNLLLERSDLEEARRTIDEAFGEVFK